MENIEIEYKVMISKDDFYKIVENKVLMYLFEDAAKTKRTRVFADSSISRFSKLCIAFRDRDISIFKDMGPTKFEDIYKSYCIRP